MISSDKFRIRVLHLLRDRGPMTREEVMKLAADGMNLSLSQQELLMTDMGRGRGRCGWVLPRGRDRVYLTMEGRKAYKGLLRLYAPDRGDAAP